MRLFFRDPGDHCADFSVEVYELLCSSTLGVTLSAEAVARLPCCCWLHVCWAHVPCKSSFESHVVTLGIAHMASFFSRYMMASAGSFVGPCCIGVKSGAFCSFTPAMLMLTACLLGCNCHALASDDGISLIYGNGHERQHSLGSCHPQSHLS